MYFDQVSPPFPCTHFPLYLLHLLKNPLSPPNAVGMCVVQCRAIYRSIDSLSGAAFLAKNQKIKTWLSLSQQPQTIYSSSARDELPGHLPPSILGFCMVRSCVCLVHAVTTAESCASVLLSPRSHFTAIIHLLRLLNSFQLLCCDDQLLSLGRGRRGCDTDVPFRVGHPTFVIVCIDPFWVSVLITVITKKRSFSDKSSEMH